jgi:hypothetical protein
MPPILTQVRAPATKLPLADASIARYVNGKSHIDSREITAVAPGETANEQRNFRMKAGLSQ